MSEQETEKPQILVVDDSRVIRCAALTMLSDAQLLQAVAEKAPLFLDYVANRSDTGRTGTDTL